MRFSETNKIYWNNAMFGYAVPPLETAGTVVLMIFYWYHSIVGCIKLLVIIWFDINWLIII